MVREIKKIFSDHELDEEATIRNFRIVQTEGSCLLELLFVLVIIGTLLSVGIPVYSLIIRRTEGVVCSTNSSHLNKMTHLDYQDPPERALRDYLNQSGQHICPSGGFYIYCRGKVGCNLHDEIEDNLVCTYNRQSLEEEYHYYLESLLGHHLIVTWNEYFLEDDRNVCPASGTLSYNSGAVVCSLHHDGKGSDDEDDGSVPFL